MKYLCIPNRFKDISKHRQFLYGFAALWIMFYHMGTEVPNRGILSPLRFFQSTGAAGVEIFLLLTGLGLYSSMKKNPSLKHFYSRRFMRVFLPGFIAMAVGNVFANQSLAGFLGSISFFAYWLGAGTAWYVAFILTMYLIYPIIFKLVNKNPLVLCIAGIVLPFAITFVAESANLNIYSRILRGISRLPAFLTGCAIAPWFENNKKLPGWALPVSVLVTVPLMILCKRMFSYGYTYFFRGVAYFAFAITLILLVSTIAELLLRCGAGKLLYRCFAFCGVISLEIYLLFGRISSILADLSGFSGFAGSGVKLDIAAAICTIIFAVALQQVTDGMIKRFSSVILPEPSRQ